MVHEYLQDIREAALKAVDALKQAICTKQTNQNQPWAEIMYRVQF